jgi:hypothetical protein
MDRKKRELLALRQGSDTVYRYAKNSIACANTVDIT